MCVDARFNDVDDAFHNELLNLMDEVVLSKNYEELAEVITKTIEIDLEAWLAFQRRRLSWPQSK